MSSLFTLPPDAFRRADESPDALFYRTPRFVTHIDDRAIAAVTQAYREYFPPDGAILDLCSSWISHLPPEVVYTEVVGLGMNREELAGNPRLTRYVVQDLNTTPLLTFNTAHFDGAGLCVSVDYLTDPVAVLTETARVLKPDAPIVITFSKAIAAWHALDDAGRVRLVAHFLEATGVFRDITALDRSPVTADGRRTSDPLFVVVARK